MNLCVCVLIHRCAFSMRCSATLVENIFHLLQANPQTFSANLESCSKCSFNFTDTYLIEALLYVQK